MRKGARKRVKLNDYATVLTHRDYIKANKWLNETAQRMKLGTELQVDCHLESLHDYAKAKSRNSERLIHETAIRLGADNMVKLIRREVERTGVSFSPDDS